MTLRLVATIAAVVSWSLLTGVMQAQVGPRPSTSAPSTSAPAASSPSGSAGSRFAAPPPASGAGRLPSTSAPSTSSGGLIGGGSSASGGSTASGGSGGGTSAIPRIPATGSSASGNIYGGAVPSTSDSGPTFGGSAGSDGSLYGGSSGSTLGGSSSGSGGGSLLGQPSSVIPRTPSSAAPATRSPRGSLPYEDSSSPSVESEASDSEAPAIGSRTGDAVGMSGIETKGYALVGPMAHHYIFGNLAVADYIDRGQRRIVTLEQETDLPKTDPNFLYYREIRDGNRWAIATKAGPDRRYSVYLQTPGAANDGQAKWRRMQRAQLQWSRRTPSITESVVFE